MDDDMVEQVRSKSERAALINAVKHESEARSEAILGPLLEQNPALRPHADDLSDVVTSVVAQVNEMDPAERKNRLSTVAPEKLADLERPDDSKESRLPDLPNTDAYDEIRLRFAPNPNGRLHIGHGRIVSVLQTYHDRYNGWLLCRFDDTDTQHKPPDPAAYEGIQNDLAYLGCEPDEVMRASDRLNTYYEYARDLIERGGAYTCACPPAEFSELKSDGEPCPHRDKDVGQVSKEFEAMINGEYDPGEMALRVRTDLEQDNQALREWVAFRIVDTPHPMTDGDERCWPLLDFQSAVDDHLTEITHIVRGIDLQTSAGKQRFLYTHFDWEYPEVVHCGKVQPTGYSVPCSGSEIAERIDTGELDGWDDPRAPTLLSLRNRGIEGEAVVQAMIDLGLSKSNVELPLSKVYANNRRLLHDSVDRAFLVRDEPDHGGIVEKSLTGGPERIERPRHPDHPERGTRTLHAGGSVYIEARDLPPQGECFGLLGYGFVFHTDDGLEYREQDELAAAADQYDKVPWVPTEASTCKLRSVGDDVSGLVEPVVRDYDIGVTLQFEDVGYARIVEQKPGQTVLHFAHE